MFFFFLYHPCRQIQMRVESSSSISSLLSHTWLYLKICQRGTVSDEPSLLLPSRKDNFRVTFANLVWTFAFSPYHTRHYHTNLALLFECWKNLSQSVHSTLLRRETVFLVFGNFPHAKQVAHTHTTPTLHFCCLELPLIGVHTIFIISTPLPLNTPTFESPYHYHTTIFYSLATHF
jgi:hypothetical protein